MSRAELNWTELNRTENKLGRTGLSIRKRGRVIPLLTCTRGGAHSGGGVVVPKEEWESVIFVLWLQSLVPLYIHR